MSSDTRVCPWCNLEVTPEEIDTLPKAKGFWQRGSNVDLVIHTCGKPFYRHPALDIRENSRYFKAQVETPEVKR